MPKKHSFTRKQSFKLIDEVFKKPCIWDPFVEDYNKRRSTEKAWKDISKRMNNWPEVLLKVKWKSLRDIYKRESRKNPEYDGTWCYFKQLSFLDYKTYEPDEPDEPDEPTTDEDEEREQDSENSNLTEIQAPRIKREPSLDLDDPLPESSTIEDFDDLFLQSLMPYFRQLDPMRKLVVRSRLQDMLFNEISAQNSGSSPP